MRKIALLGLAALALVLPTASSAQVGLGLRLGFAPAFGDASKDSNMSDGFKSQIPVQLDATYRVTNELALGGYVSYGFGQMGNAFDDICTGSGVDCSTRILRLGVQGTYALAPVDGFRPWVGAGFGWERGSLKAEAGGAEATIAFSGLELLNLQVGGDYQVNPQFSVGPFLSLSFTQYSKMTIDDPVSTTSESIPSGEKAIHEWVQLGFRGKFDL